MVEIKWLSLPQKAIFFWQKEETTLTQPCINHDNDDFYKQQIDNYLFIIISNK